METLAVPRSMPISLPNMRYPLTSIRNRLFILRHVGKILFFRRFLAKGSAAVFLRRRLPCRLHCVVVCPSSVKPSSAAPSSFARGDHFLLLGGRLFVLDLRGLPSSEMTDRFVVLQNVLDLFREGRIDLRQPFGEILVDRAFGNAEFLGDGPHGVARFHKASADLDGSLPDVALHAPASLHHEIGTLYERRGHLFAATKPDKPEKSA